MNILTTLQLTAHDIEEMAAENSGFRSMLKGYAAERMLARVLDSNPQIETWVKNSDSDSSSYCDFTVTYKGATFRIELKSEGVNGVVKLKTSDKNRYVHVGEEEEVDCVHVFETTALPADRFEILAVSTLNNGRGWGFKFFDVEDIPRANHQNIPENIRDRFLTSSFKSEDAECYTTDPFTMFDRLLAN